jgi:ATP-dependent DNA helicase RecG
LKENAHIEFKSSFNDAVIESLVAFANANGGKVLIGVDNEGLPLKNFMIGDETVQQWINEIKNKTQPLYQMPHLLMLKQLKLWNYQ